MKVLSAVVLILFAAAPANAATFILNYAIGEITGLTAGVSKAMLVVDTAGDGFTGINDPDTNNTAHFDLANFSLTAGSTVGDDMAIWIATAQDFGDGVLGFDFTSQAFNTSDGVWNGLLGTNQRLGVTGFQKVPMAGAIRLVSTAPMTSKRGTAGISPLWTAAPMPSRPPRLPWAGKRIRRL